MLSRLAAVVSERLGRQSRVIETLRPSYEWFLDVSSGGRGVAWSVNDEPLRIDPRVRHLTARVAEPELFAFLRENIRPGDTVLDVGSFVGVYAILAARWGGSKTRVVSFEPTPAILPVLRRHLEINGVAERVTVVPEAVGAEPGTVTLHTHSEPYRNAIGTTDPAGDRTGAASVPMTTLDQTCARLGVVPNLIRMDVQGFEHAVLRGAREVIRAGRGRLKIVLEAHPQLWPMQDMDPARFDAILADLGLRAKALGDRHETYVPDGHIVLEYV